MTERFDAIDLRRIDGGLMLVTAAYAVAAAVGLPLFGDGAYYFFRIALEGEPLVPNLRWTAVLGQLPVLAAWPLTDDVLALRHAFSFGYAMLPVLSLAVCWLLVRRRAPWLVLFPALTLIALQINFSGVSELLLSLHLTWPFVLLVAVHPASRWALGYGLVLGPLLLLLHPLTFALALPSVVLALWGARRAPARRRGWQLAAVLLAVAGVARLLWTALGSNAYEREHLAPDAAATYLLPDHDSQLLLLGVVLALGLALTVLGWRPADRWAGRLLKPGFALVLLLAVYIGGLFWLGEGIRLKAGLCFPLALALMAMAVAAAGRPGLPPALIGRLFGLGAAAVLVLTLSKSVAWWTATHGLMDITASTGSDCIPFAVQEPYSLQWPWMAIVDDWATPFNALVFRAPWPVALLLPYDGCERLEATGIAHLTSWSERPAARLAERFGPLRAVAHEPE